MKQTSSREVEIDLTIDVGSENYDTDADPQLKIKKQVFFFMFQIPIDKNFVISFLKKSCLQYILIFPLLDSCTVMDATSNQWTRNWCSYWK